MIESRPMAKALSSIDGMMDESTPQLTSMHGFVFTSISQHL